MYLFLRWTGNKPGENLMSAISSFLWWNDVMSSKVSAFTTRKLPVKSWQQYSWSCTIPSHTFRYTVLFLGPYKYICYTHHLFDRWLKPSRRVKNIHIWLVSWVPCSWSFCVLRICPTTWEFGRHWRSLRLAGSGECLIPIAHLADVPISSQYSE